MKIGSIAFESLFLVGLTPSTIHARGVAVQDSENSVYKMHEKDSEDSEDKMHEKESENSENSTTSRAGGRWKIEDGRWEAGLGAIAGSLMS